MASHGIHQVAPAIARDGVDTRHQGLTLPCEEAQGLALQCGAESLRADPSLLCVGTLDTDGDAVMPATWCTRCYEAAGVPFFEDGTAYCADCFWEEREDRRYASYHTCTHCGELGGRHTFPEHEMLLCDSCMEGYQVHLAETNRPRAEVGLPRAIGAGEGPEEDSDSDSESEEEAVCACCGDAEDLGPAGLCADCEVTQETLHEEEDLGRG